MNERLHIHRKPNSSTSNPVSKEQPRPKNPQGQMEIEDGQWELQKFEATKLQIQAKNGTITPSGQERLTVLQAQNSSWLQKKLEHAERFGHNLTNISVNPPNKEEISQKPLPPLAWQPKLTIGAPGDKYEQEADRVASQVVNLLHAPVTQQPNQNIQREVMPEEEELQMKPTLQLQAKVGDIAATTELESSIQQAQGGGQSLADNVRQPMEQAFGADFSGVKVHTDAKSDQLNQAIQARAFTTGQDVFFRQGEYNPTSRGGQELIAHELTHVVQQKGGRSCETRSAHCSQGIFSTNEMEEKGVDRVAQGTDQVEYSAMPQSDGLVQRVVVEAGATPIKQEKEEGNPTGVRISGLINCVGVVAQIVGPSPAFKITHVVGGHFVSPEMYDFKNNCFLPAGEEFVNKFNEYILNHDCEMEYHVAAPAVEGSKEPESLLEARRAADALKARLGRGPTIVGSSAFEVII